MSAKFRNDLDQAMASSKHPAKMLTMTVLTILGKTPNEIT